MGGGTASHGPLCGSPRGLIGQTCGRPGRCWRRARDLTSIMIWYEVTPSYQGGRHADKAKAAYTPAGTPAVWAHHTVPQTSGGAALTARGGAAHPPWAQGLADQFCVDGLSPPAWCTAACPRVGNRLRLGAGWYHLRQNVP